MDVQLEQALQSLPRESTPERADGVGRLAQLVDSDLPLQSFLELLLPQLTGLFGGVAAVVWMKAQGSSDAVIGVRYQMDPLLNSIGEHKQHERLVQLAWQQKQAMLAEAGRGAGVASLSQPPAAEAPVGTNPTLHPLLFGPILHLGEPLALLEIVLTHSEGTTLSPTQRQLYLRGVQLVAERVYGGLRRRMALPVPNISQAVQHIEKLTGEVQAMHLQIRRSIETRLQQFHGWAFSSLAENQAFAKMVHQLLESHGLRVECPECGHPAILRALRVGNAKHGAFVFDHYLETGRTFHGGPTTVPLIRVVNKPARRPAISNPA